jgi:hypothetical protein
MNTGIKQEKQKLKELLAWLLEYFPPTGANPNAPWPSWEELLDLNHAVFTVARTQRKNALFASWKTYQLVDKKWPSIRLIPRLNKLIKRARAHLQEARVSDLERLRREDLEGLPEVMQCWKDLKALRGDMCKADGIKWEEHEKVIFARGNTKVVRPACGDSLVLLRLKCYARALELIVEDELYCRPNRDKALPLLKWIAFNDNPGYRDVLKCDMGYSARSVQALLGDFVQSERQKRKRAQNLLRQNIHRLRSIFTSREREVLAKLGYRTASNEFRAKVSEAHFVQKISR